MPTLTVTSPFTRGPQVTAAQKTLNGANVFQTDYLTGPGAKVDGEFGPATGRACRRAKFHLGYPDTQLDATYGDTLEALLDGSRALPKDFKARQKRRIAAAAKAAASQTLGEKALAALAPHLGMTESPAGSNRCLFSSWYGMVGPWCAMTVTWAYVQAGSKAFTRGSRYAYVPYMVIDARAGRNGLQVINAAQAKPGDVFCVDWQKRGTSPYDFDHTGLVRTPVEGGSFGTREGNTSSDNSGDQSNGGGLYDRDRSLNIATYVFVRVGK